ncbi:hypothetical protein [Tahibacter amnicola]|uniref:Secreted protein n=1 Tax=Tahibacter amnicola TaxID=2976241 RepID=A0ABY6B884_9GAMM|nr:hypothetical protein [Tahibacter amnicola]UXI66288.1 hypothetical protein N4264_16195 [Tahibacter amnicola]
MATSPHLPLIIALCRVMGVLALRLIEIRMTRHEMGTISDLPQRHELLEGLPTNTSASGALIRVLTVQRRLLQLANADGPLDHLQVCVALQELAGGPHLLDWSRIVVRLAAKLECPLPESPRHICGPGLMGGRHSRG